MADTKISALPAASALSGTEQLPLVQSSNSVQATLATLLAWALKKLVVNNNASASYTPAVTTPQTLIAFTGTNVANLTINLPAASAAIDGWTVTIGNTASVATVAFASSGATFPSPTTSFAANGRTSYTFDFPSLQWLRS